MQLIARVSGCLPVALVAIKTTAVNQPARGPEDQSDNHPSHRGDVTFLPWKEAETGIPATVGLGAPVFERIEPN